MVWHFVFGFFFGISLILVSMCRELQLPTLHQESFTAGHHPLLPTTGYSRQGSHISSAEDAMGSSLSPPEVKRPTD